MLKIIRCIEENHVSFFIVRVCRLRVSPMCALAPVGDSTTGDSTAGLVVTRLFWTPYRGTKADRGRRKTCWSSVRGILKGRELWQTEADRCCRQTVQCALRESRGSGCSELLLYTTQEKHSHSISSQKTETWIMKKFCLPRTWTPDST